jgi:hypothetical protein
MPKILVVEGLTDAFFFQELLIRLYLDNADPVYDERPGRRNIPRIVRGTLRNGAPLEFEFRNQEGRTLIPDAMRGLIDAGVIEFVVAQDIDRASNQQTVQSVRQMVYSYLGIPQQVDVPLSREIALQGGNITIVPMGLESDSTMSSLGVAKHELEDYLVKLILEDPGLREGAPNLQELLLEILPIVRAHDGLFDSGKELFQLIKPIVQHGFSDTAVVRKVIQDADNAILRAILSPILGDLESAFGL